MNIRAKQKGVAVVELALILPLLLTLAFGITEFGRAVYEYNAITKAVRDSVRYLSENAPGDLPTQTSAKCLVVYGNSGCTGTSILPHLDVSKVIVQDAVSDPGHKLQPITVGGITTGSANLVTVQVSGYKFVSMMSFVVPDITFAIISATMLQTS